MTPKQWITKTGAIGIISKAGRYGGTFAHKDIALNMALFGMTAKQWRETRPEDKGNIRDYANAAQLICLSNLENLNAHFIADGLERSERLTKLNGIAIRQMQLLIDDSGVKRLGGK